MKDNLIFEQTIEKGGITLKNAEEFRPLTGFFVGGLAPTKIVNPVQDEVILALCELILAGNDIVGTWLHEGQVHCDATEWIEDKDEALTIGKERGEIAIWDVGNDTEIVL